MDKDSIKEFLEKRHRELLNETGIPVLNKPKKEPEQVSSKDVSPNKGLVKKITVYLTVSLIVCILVFFLVNVYKEWSLSRLDNEQFLIQRLSELTEIPKEKPTIATVTNTDSLRSQIFFKEARVGDKLVIFKESKKALLYRPETNKIISIAPLN